MWTNSDPNSFSRYSVTLAARCRAAWAGQWVEAVFSSAPRDIRRTCSTSPFTRWRSLTPTHTALLRIRNPIAVYRPLMVEPPPRQEDSLQDQVVRPTNQPPPPPPVSFRFKRLFVCCSCSIFKAASPLSFNADQGRRYTRTRRWNNFFVSGEKTFLSFIRGDDDDRGEEWFLRVPLTLRSVLDEFGFFFFFFLWRIFLGRNCIEFGRVDFTKG